VAIVLCILAILFRVDKLGFIISRYRSFQRFIRRRKLDVDRKAVTICYSNIILIGALILFIGIIAQLMFPIDSEVISFWTWIAIIPYAICAELYITINKRFIIEIEE
jgi:hypothetical protein